MSLTKVSFRGIVKKQYQFKLGSYSGMFTSLVTLQILGILSSLLGVSSEGASSQNIFVDISYYSANTVIMFTMIWVFISSILVTTKAHREDGFTFVTNRLSNNVANILFLLTASVIGGTTAYLSGFLIRVIIRFSSSLTYLSSSGFSATLQEFLSGFSALILYMILLSALGYLIGTIVQLHRVFIFIIPGVFIGSLILSGMLGVDNLLEKIAGFYFMEPSIWLFIIKISISSSLFFICSILLSNRQEVRL